MNKWRIISRDEAVKLFFEDSSRNIFQIDIEENYNELISDIAMANMYEECDTVFYAISEEENE